MPPGIVYFMIRRERLRFGRVLDVSVAKFFAEARFVLGMMNHHVPFNPRVLLGRLAQPATASRAQARHHTKGPPFENTTYGAGGLKPGSRLILGFYKARRTVVVVAYSLRA